MKRIFALLILLATFAIAQTDSTDILITIREDGDTTQVGKWRAGMPVLIRDSWDGWGSREKLPNKFVIIRSGISKAMIDSFLVAHTDSTTGLRRKYQLSRAAIQFVKNNRDANNIARVTPVQLRNAFKRANRLRRFGESQRMSIIPDRLYIRWRNMLIGATPTSATVNTDGGGDYTSLAAAEAGEQKDLVTANEQLTISCSGTTADVTAVTFDGWTTDATRNIIYRGDNNTGLWDSSKARFELTGGGDFIVGNVDFEANNLFVDANNESGAWSFLLLNATNKTIVVKNSFFAKSPRAFYISGCTNINVFLSNSIITDAGQYGIFIASSTGNLYTYNICINNAQTRAFYATGLSVIAKNVIVQNSTITGFFGTFAAGSDYNISDKADAPGANSLNSTTVNFADAANGDFRLLAGSPGIDQGTPDTTGLGLPPTDIAGNARVSNSRIDIGAFEYQVSTPTNNTKKSRYKGFGTGFKGGWRK